MKSSEQTATVHLGLGANLGDRAGQLRGALHALDDLPETTLLAASPPYRTEPRIVHDQPRFLNACATIETALAPRKLLDHLQRIERAHGPRADRQKGPRHLDLDILLWENLEMETDRLTIPHPGLAERRFVLAPLTEIAPDVRDPRTGETIRRLLARCEDQGAVERIDWPEGD